MKTTKTQRRAALAIAKTIPVPAKFAEFAFEWREGYAHGLAGSSRDNPITHGGRERDETTAEMLQDARDAWGAGRDDGRRERERRIKAREDVP